MPVILVVDFGASRVKTLLYDIVKCVVLDREECVSPSSASASPINGRYEIPIEDYWQALLKTAGKIILRNPEKNIKQMWICSEMHGFVLARMDGSAITPYISWKDQRANFDGNGGISTFDQLKSELPYFQAITGMALRSGLPVLTLASMLRDESIAELRALNKDIHIRMLSLVDWLLFRGGEQKPKANITLAAGLGIFDVNKKDVSQKILDCESLSKLKILGMPIESDMSNPLGKIFIFDSEILIFGGIGDFQAAIQGSGFFEGYDAVINLGTGSQVGVKSSEAFLSVNNEIRVMADCSSLKVITHIPCGRALNVFSSFLNAFSTSNEGVDKFWRIWSSLSALDVINSRLVSNLALFESAWGRSSLDHSNGTIGLNEGSTAYDVVAGIAKSWLLQYVKALDTMDPSLVARKVVICGGVGQKSNFVVPVLEHLMPQRRFYLASNHVVEETLDGLLQLAIKINN